MAAAQARGRVWFLPCLLLLILGAGLRWLLLTPHAERLREIVGAYGYSDIAAFYGVHSLAQHPLPYLDLQLEYPVLTGLTIWITSFAPGDAPGYFLANATLLTIALVASLAYLRRAGQTVWLPYFALAPALMFYGTLNWDALGVLGVAAGLYYTRRERFAAAGVALALGASAKLFPAFILPVLWAHAVALARAADTPTRAIKLHRQLLPPAALRLLGGFGTAALAVNLPVLLAAPNGWSYFLRFQAGRDSNLDSIWTHLPDSADQVQTLVFAQIVVFGTLWLVARVLRGARWEVAALLTLLLFLLPTKIYSPQYDLWLLPFLAILAPPVWLWLAYVVADALYYWAIFHFYGLYFAGMDQAAIDSAFAVVGLGVWWREAALALLLVWGLLHLRGLTERPSGPVRLLRAMAAQGRELHQLERDVHALQAEVARLRRGDGTQPPGDADEGEERARGSNSTS